MFVSIWSALLGIHGFYILFTRSSLTASDELDKLFLGWRPPLLLADTVSWASDAGLRTWFMPLFLVVLGLVIWNLQARMTTPKLPVVRKWLKKLHLW